MSATINMYAQLVIYYISSKRDEMKQATIILSSATSSIQKVINSVSQLFSDSASFSLKASLLH